MKNSSFILLIFIFALVSCNDPNPVLTVEGGRVIGVQTATEGIIAF